MPSAEEIATAVWKHKISNQFRTDGKGNPRLVAAEDFLEYSDAHHDAVMARLKAQGAVIDKLVDAIAAAQPDLETLKVEIREAIESIVVRFDATPEE